MMESDHIRIHQRGTDIAEKSGFELIATYFANPLVVWTYSCQRKHRDKWIPTRNKLYACRTHTAEEIDEYIRREERDARSIRDITLVDLRPYPTSVAIGLRCPLVAGCAVCSKIGIVGLREPLTDSQEIAQACQQMANECGLIRREAEYWRELLIHVAERLMRRELTGDSP